MLYFNAFTDTFTEDRPVADFYFVSNQDNRVYYFKWNASMIIELEHYNKEDEEECTNKFNSKNSQFLTTII